MADIDLDLTDTPFLLARSHHAFRAFADKSLRESGLNGKIDSGTGAVFLAIANAEGSNVKEIASTLQLPKASISDILRKLEKQKLIRREKDPDDARAFRLFLDKAGSRILPKMISRHQVVLDEMHAGLSAREVTTLKRLLDRVLRNISGSGA